MAFNKDRAIIGQNAATAAATILAGTGATTDEFEALRTSIAEGSLAFADDGLAASATPPAGSPQRGGSGGQSTDHGAGVVVKFGQYSGQTIEAIHSQDAEYVQWLADSSNNPFIKGKAAEFLANRG